MDLTEQPTASRHASCSQAARLLRSLLWAFGIGLFTSTFAETLQAEDVEAVPRAKLTRQLADKEDIAQDAADRVAVTAEAEAAAEAEAEVAEEEHEADDGLRVPRAKLTRKIEGVEKPRAAQNRAVPAANMVPLNIDPLNNVEARLKKYMPALEQCLTLEIHFLRKVCNPSEEQLKPIRIAGKKKLVELAQEFAKNENGAFRNDEKGARDLLREEILDAAKQVLDKDDLELYTRELDLRHQARYRGIAELMTLHSDSMLSFDTDQFEAVSEAIQKKPEPTWTRGMQSLFYSEYSPKPGIDLLSPVLNDKQKQLLSNEPRRNSTIWFGWPRNIGMQQFGSDFGLEELPAYDQQEEPK